MIKNKKQSKKQKTNLIIALTILIVILGILDLLAFQFILDKKINNQIIQISQLSLKNLEEIVKIQGTIIKTKQIATHSLATLQDETGKITLFCDCQLEINQTITVKGKIQQYQGQLQIYVEEIGN